MDSHQLAAPSCRCRACPAALSPSAWAAPGALRVGPAPSHASRPAPRGSAPSWRGRLQSRGSGAKRPRPHVERPPAPPRTQPSVPRRGAANPRREKAEVPPLRGPGERGEPQKDAVCGSLRSTLFLERRRQRRERTLVSSPASGPVALPDSRPGLRGNVPFRAQPRWPGAAVWPEHRLTNSEGWKGDHSERRRSQRRRLRDS